MNQRYKINFQDISNETDRKSDGQKDNDQPNHIAYSPKNLCLIWEDGRSYFLNYSYLLSGSFDPDSSIISLQFTAIKVIIKGHMLQKLYYGIVLHRIQSIECFNERYTSILDEIESQVSEIELLQTS